MLLPHGSNSLSGPVAGFGATGAGLDVQEGVHRVGRLVEHAPELQRLDGFGELARLGLDREEAGFVTVVAAHLEQLEVVRQLAVQLLQRDDDVVELLLFPAQFLGLLGVVPDRRVFQRGVDGPQALGFGIVVKDTSGDPRSATAGLPGCRR